MDESRGSVLRERARRHYESKGYFVDVAPALAVGQDRFMPDFVVRSERESRAVRVDDDPLGTYEVGAMAAKCRRLRMKATIICPATPELLEACDQFGVQHLSPEGLGEEAPMIAARPRPATPRVAVRSSVRAPEPVPVRPAPTPVPAWRWAVVTAIWLAAVVAWTILLVRIF